MKDNKVVCLRRNQTPWQFYTEPYKNVVLVSDSEKRCYAYYDTALTYYLLNRQKYTNLFLDEAQKLEIDEEGPVRLLLQHKISKLQEEQNTLQKQLDEFKNVFFARNSESRNSDSYKICVFYWRDP
jgi:hypothetical protein